MGFIGMHEVCMPCTEEHVCGVHRYMVIYGACGRHGYLRASQSWSLAAWKTQGVRLWEARDGLEHGRDHTCTEMELRSNRRQQRRW